MSGICMRHSLGSRSSEISQLNLLSNAIVTLLLISFMVLDLDHSDSAEILSLCFSLMELVISIIGLTGGVDMLSINIVVGIGCYGGGTKQ